MLASVSQLIHQHDFVLMDFVFICGKFKILQTKWAVAVRPPSPIFRY